MSPYLTSHFAGSLLFLSHIIRAHLALGQKKSAVYPLYIVRNAQADLPNADFFLEKTEIAAFQHEICGERRKEKEVEWRIKLRREKRGGNVTGWDHPLSLPHFSSSPSFPMEKISKFPSCDVGSWCLPLRYIQYTQARSVLRPHPFSVSVCHEITLAPPERSFPHTQKKRIKWENKGRERKNQYFAGGRRRKDFDGRLPVQNISLPAFTKTIVCGKIGEDRFKNIWGAKNASFLFSFEWDKSVFFLFANSRFHRIFISINR